VSYRRDTGDRLHVLLSAEGVARRERTRTGKEHLGSVGDCSRNLTTGALRVRSSSDKISIGFGMTVRNRSQRQRAEERRCWAHENVDVVLNQIARDL